MRSSPKPSEHCASILYVSSHHTLRSTAQMPRGVPVATVAIGNATNAGLLAVRILGASDGDLRRKMADYMDEQEAEVLVKAAKLESDGYRTYLDEMGSTSASVKI